MFAFAGLSIVFGLAAPWIIQLPFLLAIIAALIVLIILLIFILMLIDRTRRSEHRGLIWALAAGAQRGVPLSESARAFSDETLSDTGARAMALAEALERGQSLTESVRQARLRMGTAMKVAVRVGERVGALGPAMRQQFVDSQAIESALRDAIGRLLYLATVILAMLMICIFMMLKIIPVFQRMFEEFGVKLPAMTMLVIHVSRWFADLGWIFVVLFVLLPAPLLALAGLMFYVGWVPRNLPLIWRLFRRYDGALMMRAMALTIRRQIPLVAAMELVAAQYPITIVGRRLHQVAAAAAGGAEWTEALRGEALIDAADAAVLKSAERVGNLDWALEEMADRALRRETYRVQVVLQVLFPLALFAVAAMVFLFVVGLFMPLVKLIDSMA